jgi:Tfp pilus assembly protein PilF
LDSAEIAAAEAALRVKKRRTEFFAGPPRDMDRPDLEEMAITRTGRMMVHRLNSRISRYLNAARDTQDEGNPAAGLELIAKLNPNRLNPMERASVFLVEALLYYASGELDATVASFRKVIDEQIMPLRQDTNLRYNIAQILASQFRWEETIEALYEWFRFVPDPPPDAYYLLGIANFQLENMDVAIVNTEKAIELADEPKEGWLQLLAALYIQDEDHASATPVLEELVVRFPKKAYWVQLGLVYGARENYRVSLAVQQVAYAQGLLTEDKELRRLARSYLYADLPYPAAQVLDKGISDGSIETDPKSLELLANSWIAAREFEKSLPPLTLAAESAEDGNLYLRLGQVFLQREDWNTAAKRFEDAIQKGGLKRPGQAQLLLGIAYYNDAQVFRAKSSFIQAADHEKTREQAELWITHLEGEQQAS